MILPSAPKDELAIIGCCLLGGLDTAIDAVEAVNCGSFMREDLRSAFSVIESLATQGQEVNTYTLARRWSELKLGSLPNDILSAADATATASNLPLHVASVTEAWRKRRIVEGANQLLGRAQDLTTKSDELIAQAEAFLYSEEIKSVPTLDAKESAVRLVDDLERRHQLQGKLSGIETGFYRFDQLTDGLQFGEQTIIGARPSMGKSALGGNIIEHACLRSHIASLFVSLEMSPTALCRRMLSSWCRIPMNEIRRGSYTQDRFQTFTIFNDILRHAPIHFIDATRGLDISRLSAAIRRICRRHSCKLVVVDYLQKIRPTERQEKRTYEIGEISGQLRSLAQTTGAAFLTLAQLNRESEKDKGRPPRLADLADSGQIERDADCVALIHRDRSQKEGPAQLIVAKQRDGETGIAELFFYGQFCRFENLSHAPEPDTD